MGSSTLLHFTSEHFWPIRGWTICVGVISFCTICWHVSLASKGPSCRRHCLRSQPHVLIFTSQCTLHTLHRFKCDQCARRPPYIKWLINGGRRPLTQTHAHTQSYTPAHSHSNTLSVFVSFPPISLSLSVCLHLSPSLIVRPSQQWTDGCLTQCLVYVHSPIFISINMCYQTLPNDKLIHRPLCTLHRL